jgi:hypothetical protein
MDLILGPDATIGTWDLLDAVARVNGCRAKSTRAMVREEMVIGSHKQYWRRVTKTGLARSDPRLRFDDLLIFGKRLNRTQTQVPYSSISTTHRLLDSEAWLK